MKFGPTRNQTVKDAYSYYEYNTNKCLENLCDYRLITWNYNMNYYMKIDSQSEHD